MFPWDLQNNELGGSVGTMWAVFGRYRDVSIKNLVQPKILAMLTPCFLFLLYLSHLYYVMKHAVDVPVSDEWSLLFENALPSGFTAEWLLLRHNEHIIVWTKLQNWLLFHFTGLDMQLGQFINFLLYGAVLLSLYRIAVRVDPKCRPWMPLFLIFCLSDINWENHSWAFQSSFHFTILFTNLTILCLFHERLTPWRGACGVFFGLATLVSLSTGATAVISIILVLALYEVYRKKTLSSFLGTPVLSILALGVGVSFWLSGFHQINGHPLPSYPWTLSFWKYLINLISFGMGVHQVNTILGGLCFLLVAFPIIVLVKRKWHCAEIGDWTLLAGVGSILAILVTVSVGRAGFGLGGSKTSRYAEFALMLIPYTALAWARLFEGSPRLKPAIVVLFAAFFLSFSNCWRWDAHYLKVRRVRNEGLKCLAEYYQKGENSKGVTCLGVYPREISHARLERAKELKLSFYRKLKTGS